MDKKNKPAYARSTMIDRKKMIKSWEQSRKNFRPILGRINPLWTVLSPVLCPIVLKAISFKTQTAEYRDVIKNAGVPIIKLYNDIAYSVVALGAELFDYKNLNFLETKMRFRDKYMTRGKELSVIMSLQNMDKLVQTDDKGVSSKLLSKWMKRDVVTLREKDDIPNCIEFLNKHDPCFLKPIWGSFGKGVQRISTAKIRDPVSFFEERLTETKWILEEEIIQHPMFAAISPNSVATVRLHTLRSEKGEVRVLAPYIRMGWSHDVAVGFEDVEGNIDIDTGMIYGYVLSYDNNYKVTHPDTGEIVVGLEMPEWDKVKEMVTEMAKVFDGIRVIGWDLTYTADKGWVVIEANSFPSFPPYELAVNRGVYDDVMELVKWSKEN